MFSKFSRQFSTNPARKALPALFYVLAKPIARVTAFAIGKTARRYWRSLSAEQKTLIRKRLAANRTNLVLAGGSVGSGLWWSYESHVQACPVTGRRRSELRRTTTVRQRFIRNICRFVSLYPEQMEEISRKAFEES